MLRRVEVPKLRTAVPASDDALVFLMITCGAIDITKETIALRRPKPPRFKTIGKDFLIALTTILDATWTANAVAVPDAVDVTKNFALSVREQFLNCSLLIIIYIAVERSDPIVALFSCSVAIFTSLFSFDCLISASLATCCSFTSFSYFFCFSAFLSLTESFSFSNLAFSCAFRSSCCLKKATIRYTRIVLYLLYWLHLVASNSAFSVLTQLALLSQQRLCAFYA